MYVCVFAVIQSNTQQTESVKPYLGKRAIESHHFALSPHQLRNERRLATAGHRNEIKQLDYEIREASSLRDNVKQR